MNPNPRETLRAIVRGAYDLQKIRIQTGLRVVAIWRAKAGLTNEPKGEVDTSEEDGEAEEEEADVDPKAKKKSADYDAERDGPWDEWFRKLQQKDRAKKLLKELKRRYKRLTDGLVRLPTKERLETDDMISTFTEFALIGQYCEVLKNEEAHFRRMGIVLDDFPIYADHLKHIDGIGPAMGGVILSEFDITKCRNPSSMWAYAGLDVVTYMQLAAKYRDVDVPIRFHGAVPESVVWDDVIGKSGFVLLDTSGMVVARYEPRSEGRSRRAEHLVPRVYVDKNGEEKTKQSITFNPWLKTKLIGVLASSFLRRADSPYRAIYDQYKFRIENHERHGIVNDKVKDDQGRFIASKGHRHNMAMRYMMKMFIKAELYVPWRKIEGLPVSLSYQDAKLRATG